jgi:hypothetical protein
MLVTIFGVAVGWVVYQLNWIHQRHELLQKRLDRRARQFYAFGVHHQELPWSLRLFGEQPDHGVFQIPESLLPHASSMIPEAVFILMPDN